MTSMFDQFEQPSLKSKNSFSNADIVSTTLLYLLLPKINNKLVQAVVYYLRFPSTYLLLQTTLGFINMNLDQDAPIFSKTKKDLTPADKVTHVAVSNKHLVVAMANNSLFRMNLHQPQNQDGLSSTFVN